MHQLVSQLLMYIFSADIHLEIKLDTVKFKQLTL